MTIESAVRFLAMTLTDGETGKDDLEVDRLLARARAEGRDNRAIASRTIIPERTIRAGMNSAHANPITVCL